MMTYKQQLDSFGPVLSDMQEYLQRLEQGCLTLPMGVHTRNKDHLNQLLQIVEGMEYCRKLLHSASVLQGVDVASPLCGEDSVASFSADLCQVSQNICQAAESEDYSLVTDLVECDLVPIIQSARRLLAAILKRMPGEEI
jgi:hypothetical protein